MPLILGANSVSGGYEIDNSLRFNSGSSDFLNRTPASSGNRKTWTWSSWVKKSVLGSGYQFLFSCTDASNSTGSIGTNYNGDNKIYFRDDLISLELTPSAVHRDLSAWYHIVVALDTTQATASNRAKIWINGEQITSFSTSTYPTQNSDGSINLVSGSYVHRIGTYAGSSNFFNGYASEINFIDGQALDPTSFGETDFDTGIWKPKAYTGSYGTNGFYLQFKNSASLGTDSSGNGNTFTVNNLTSVDQSTDTPTNNFATWNPLNAYNSTTAGTLSEGNLKNSGTATDGGIPSTIGVSAGKWYWEVKYTTQVGGDPVLGIISSSGASKMQNANSGSVTSGSGVWCMFNLTSGGVGFQENGVFVSYPSSTLANGDILNIALDVDARKLWFGKNGTWYNSGNPATGANAISTNLTASETWFAYCEKRNGSSVWETNFGNPTYSASSYADGAGYGNFSYAVPSGYYSLNTKNLADYG